MNKFTGYFGEQRFRIWCQKVLPTVYDDSLSYYELLCKVLKVLQEFGTELSTFEGFVNETLVTNVVDNTERLNAIAEKVKVLNKLPNQFGETWSFIVSNDYNGYGIYPHGLSKGVYVVSILYDETNDTPLASGLFAVDEDGTALINVYPALDEFDYGIISVSIGGGDLYIQGESRLMEWLHGKRVTFTRIL